MGMQRERETNKQMPNVGTNESKETHTDKTNAHTHTRIHKHEHKHKHTHTNTHTHTNCTETCLQTVTDGVSVACAVITKDFKQIDSKKLFSWHGIVHKFDHH
jgi:ABC-type Zn2+ transport system substrate-binding protein/surface adhesin